MKALKSAITELRTVDLTRDECVVVYRTRPLPREEQNKLFARVLRRRAKLPVSADPLIELQAIRDSGATA